MARSKKTSKSKTAAKARGTARAKKTTKKATKKATRRTPATKTARGRKASRPAAEETDVERRWREYWECRTALEASVAAVRAAQTSLSEAREDERERREVFDRTKSALRDLLEVEPASSSADPGGEMPRRFERAARLGVVEPEQDETEQPLDDGAEEA